MKILYITTRKLFDELGDEEPFAYLAEICEPIIHKHTDELLISDEEAYADCGESILLTRGITEEEARQKAIHLIESHIYDPDEE
ncbi:MAG: hypothetical protein ACP5I1_19675 [Candidatus Hinthialibacter sp.]